MLIHRIFLNEVHSTNVFASELVAKSTPNEGTVISTYNQTQGRGQIGRSWDSKPGLNLSFSLILYPKHMQPKNQFELNMLVALALTEVLEERLPHEVHIKWPNDIIVNDLKIAGILIQCGMSQRAIQSAVCGIGLNVLQDDFDQKSYRATSMKMLDTKSDYNLDELEKSICERILQHYYKHKQHQHHSLKRAYLQKLYKRGDKVTFQHVETNQHFDAEIIGVDEIGRLSLHIQGHVRHFQMGELKMLY